MPLIFLLAILCFIRIDDVLSNMGPYGPQPGPGPNPDPLPLVNSKFIASGLGDNVNIYPVKGYSITILLNDKESMRNAPYVSLLDDKAKIVSSRFILDET